jgi:hypothetical protein
LINGTEEIIKQTAAWSLGQIGYHSNDHARAMAESDNPAIAVLLRVSTIFHIFRTILFVKRSIKIVVDQN